MSEDTQGPVKLESMLSTPSLEEAGAMVKELQDIMTNRALGQCLGVAGCRDLSNGKGISGPARKSIWFLWSLFKAPENFSSLTSIRTCGKIKPVMGTVRKTIRERKKVKKKARRKARQCGYHFKARDRARMQSRIRWLIGRAARKWRKVRGEPWPEPEILHSLLLTKHLSRWDVRRLRVLYKWVRNPLKFYEVREEAKKMAGMDLAPAGVLAAAWLVATDGAVIPHGNSREAAAARRARVEGENQEMSPVSIGGLDDASVRAERGESAGVQMLDTVGGEV